jgi:hypothetical protein
MNVRMQRNPKVYSVAYYSNLLQKPRILRKVVGVINLSEMSMTITRIPFVYKCIHYWLFIFQDKIDGMVKGIFGKGVINAPSNVLRILYLGTRFFCKRVI